MGGRGAWERGRGGGHGVLGKEEGGREGRIKNRDDGTFGGQGTQSVLWCPGDPMRNAHTLNISAQVVQPGGCVAGTQCQTEDTSF